MEKILGGLVLVNGTDIWSTYGVFLVEDKRGGMDNLTAILTPSKTKTDTAVNIREEDGEKYSSVLTPRNEARDVTLHFALFGKTQAGWLKKYFEFINFLKKGRDSPCEIYGLQQVPASDLSLEGRRARRQVQGEVPGTCPGHINVIQTLFKRRLNKIQTC